MILDKREHYKNKTWRFLFPCLRAYGGDEFMNRLAKLSILAVGVGDKQLSHFPYIYILYNKEFKQELLYELLAYLYKEGLLVENYNIEPEENGIKTMVVIRLPKEYHKTYQHFIKGEFSKMFTFDQMEDLFYSKKDGVRLVSKLWKPELGVLNKDVRKGKEYLKEVNSEWGTTIKFKEIEDWEYEAPLVFKEEIFNYE